MKDKCRRLATQFAPTTRYEVTPVPATPFRGTQETDLEGLKNRLLRVMLAEARGADLNVRLRRAANEAAALAWLTPYPLLVFPELLGEKAREAQNQAIRQARVRLQSRPLAMEVA